MTNCRITVDVVDTNRIPNGKAFYDNFEKVLNFAIKSRGKFYSYIQSDQFSIDLDRRGNILNIEVNIGKEFWEIDPSLRPPENCPYQKLRFLDHRLDILGETFYTDESASFLYISFTNDKHFKTCEIARNLLAEVNLVNEIAGLWILDIEDDYGFKNEMAYRKGKATAKKK